MSEESSRKRYLLVAGIDFGTSFTKVIVQEQTQKYAQVATFGGGEWLFPSVIGYDNGLLEGPFCAPLRNPIPYLKMQIAGLFTGGGSAISRPPPKLQELLGVDTYTSSRDLLAWYFANVLSAVKHFITTQSRWGDFDFTGCKQMDRLVVQVCIPTGYMDNENAKRCFHEALALAYILSDRISPLMNQVCPFHDWRRLCSKESHRIPDLCQSLCFTYPEVAAGMQSILRSPTAQDGLYVTVDVGAGTIDMNAFRRYTAQGVTGVEDKPNRLDYYAAKVAPYGVARIAGKRSRETFAKYTHIQWEGDSELSLPKMPEADVMRQVTNLFEDLFASAQRYQKNLKPLGSFWSDDPQNLLKTWDSTRVYAWGGGYEYRPYRETIAATILSRIRAAEPKTLPIPDGLFMPGDASYQRLSIAYGLSFLIANLEDVRLPEDLKPYPRDERNNVLPKIGEEGYWTSPAVQGENTLYD